MSSVVLSSVMPDFRSPHFARQLAAYSNRNRHLGASFLLSLTAATLGLPVEFLRSQSDAGCVIRTFPQAVDLPTFYRIQSGQRQHFFWGAASDVSIPLAASRDTRDNSRAKLLLSKAGVPTPIGGALTAQNTTVLDGLIAKGVERFVLKPLFRDQRMAPVYDATLDQVRTHLIEQPNTAFLVTQYISGTDMRFIVVEDAVVSAQLILRPHLVGDGQRTLADHLDIKRRLLARHPFYANRVYDRDRVLDALAKEGLERDGVLPAGKRLSLPVSDQGHIPETVDITDQLPPKLTEPVLKTARCFNLKVTQVDAVMTENGNFFVQGLNGNADLRHACLPLLGKWTLRAPEAILRAHFPKITDQPRRVERYDFVQLMNEYRSVKGRTKFNAQDYISFE